MLLSRVEGEVRFDDGSRALYATDGSNYRQVPIGVVVPRSTDDVLATLEACRKVGAPVLARGGGTSLAGQCCNVAVVMDFSKYMNRVLEINAAGSYARVQPGVVLDDLRKQATLHGLTFGPDPATHNHCTLGGMIGNNSCGVHSVMAGRTSDNVEDLDIVTYDGHRMRVGRTSDDELEKVIREAGRRGDIYRRLKALRDRYAQLVRDRYPKIPRRVSGYNLDELLPENGFNVARALVGSECTCVIVNEAKLRLVKNPAVRTLVVLGYPDVYSAGDHIPEVMSFGPIGCEGIDDHLVSYIKKKNMHIRDLDLLPEGNGWLLVEFGGDTRDESDDKGRRMIDALRGSPNAPKMQLYDDRTKEQMIWEIRESGLGATAFVPGEPVTWEGWEDSAVPPDKVGAYLRDFRKLLEKHGYGCALYGHFGQGCIHTRIDFVLSSADGIANYRSFVEEAADVVISYGGSLSGEHGDGQSRAELLPKMFGPELIEAFREFKSIWDPEWKMNPGKVVSAYRLDDNLRLGEHYRPWEPKTHFHYPEDHGSFANAALRCVGVGECRRHEGKTMCPSYRATLEEMHTTRGRAHLLFEMVKGDVLHDGWRDESVRESLDLCLACKGCKGDCPVNVDMATYKAEFLAHYYEGRIRPRHAYAFGNVDIWAALASNFAGIANLVTQTPGLSAIAKFAAGMPQQRQIPAFAPVTFKKWFRERPVRNGSRPKVLLWPDTFNNYFLPHTSRAAVEVLEAAGFQVVVPQERLCCGRPLYDFGMLDRAKRLIRRTLDVLGDAIDSGIPVVGLEPSCVAVFRDEMPNLFPNDEHAKRLHDQTYIFSDFLEQHAKDFAPPPLHRKAIVQGHCHHKALFRMDTEEAALKRAGLDCEIPNNGCCGLAGSFGFEKDKYDVSMKIAEIELKPLLERATPETIIVADGFSCREQIAQTSDRHALHLAEVMQMALHGEQSVPKQFPEQEIVAVQERERKLSILRVTLRAAAGLAVIAGGALIWAMRRK
ncbi:MAG TPA: FAD-linked oxidase C-terminal domain-containing protein [Clostridia bacterium]|nr:FAD-linked oxidase C-terminal domain-containing protein [Clostridia bacterium]